MDWKDYTDQPDEGTFEKIQNRLRVRRLIRWGSAVVVVAVATVVAVALLSKPTTQLVSTDVAEMQTHATDEAMVTEETVSTIYESLPSETSISDKRHETELVSESTTLTKEAIVADKTQKTTVQRPNIAVASHVAEAGKQTSVPDQLLPDLAQLPVSNIDSVIEAYSSKAGEPQPDPYHEDDLVWAPNVIIPGGDVDDNRTFKIKASSTLNDFIIHIYNRRGQRLFSSTDMAFQWDATYRGAALPQGAYVWIITYRDSEGKPCRRTGEVIVLR